MKNRKNLIINVVLYALFHALKVFFFQDDNRLIIEMVNSEAIAAVLIALLSAIAPILHYFAIAIFFYVLYSILKPKITFQEAKDMSEKCLIGYFFLSLSSFALFLLGKGYLSAGIYAMIGYIPYYVLSIINCYKNVLNDKWEKGKKILFVLLYAIVLILLTTPGGLNE